MAWVPGTLGVPSSSSGTQSHQMPSVTATYRVLPSMIQLLLVLRLTGPGLNSWPFTHAQLDGICTSWFPGTTGIPGSSPGTLSHQIPSVLPRPTGCMLPSMIQLLLVLSLTGPRTQFLAIPACSSGQHFHGICPAYFGSSLEISGDQLSPNAVRCRDVPDASSNEAAVFFS